MKKFIFASLAIITLAFYASSISHEGGHKAKLGDMAPDFTLVSADGNKHSLSDFKGKFVVLEWVNYGCPFVKKHYKSENMQKLQSEMTGKDVVWLAICSSAEGKQGYYEGKELVKEIENQKANHTAYLIDNDGSVGKMYNAKTTPNMYVVSPEGKLIYTGAIDDKRSVDIADVEGAKNYVRTALTEAMDGKSVSTASTKPYGCGVKYK